MSAVTLAGVLATLDPARRARLAAIQRPDVRAQIQALTKSSAPATSKGKLRTPRIDGDPLVTFGPGRVDVVLKGLELQLSPNRIDSHTNPHAVGRVRAAERLIVDAALALIPRNAAPAFPVEVVVTRCGPRAMDDDNRTPTAKGIRDSISRWLGVDDRDPRVRFIVRGDEGGGQGYAVRFSIVGGAR